ncbi:MAG: LLM class flavin-dependent oxidoreductase [Chloroflexi bacterium]|nr:LLM class flavin-dependent oxidoreductase [Chloroflexota bacterium]
MTRIALTFYSVLRMPVADIIECAQAAEKAGFQYISFAESFYRDGPALAATIASRTTRIQLGTSVLPIYTRTPFQLAMAMATLHEISGGRVGYLGIGIGYRSRTETYFGINIERPLERMRETVEIIRLLLSGKDASHAGKVFRFSGFPKLTPDPLPIPIYFGSSGDRMLTLAGEIADGGILNSIPTPGHIRHARQVLQRGAAKAGRDPGRLTVAASVIYSVSDNLEEAAAAAKEDVLFYLGYPEINPILEQSGLMKAAESVRQASREHGKRLALELIDKPMLDALAVYGDAKRCRARLKELMEAGIDLPIIRVSNALYPEADKKRVFLRAIESLQGF